MHCNLKHRRRLGKFVTLIAMAALVISLLSVWLSISKTFRLNNAVTAKDPIKAFTVTTSETQSFLKPNKGRGESLTSDSVSPEQSAHSLIKLAEERAKLRLSTTHGKPTACYDQETIKSPSINMLGTYPQDKRYLTIGISSISRPTGQSYLEKTTRHLMDNFSEEERKDIFVVIFLADFDEAHKSEALTQLANGFQKYISQGLLHVIFAPRGYYPPLSNMKKKYGDSQPRIFWRSKLVLDFTFLMCYCRDLSQYYLHLEDDVIPTPNLYSKLRDFISSQTNPWPILDAASMGHVAKIYHSSDLENIASFLYLLYDEMPVDWLIISWRKIKYHDKFILPPASLFQHIGDNSSFQENKFSYKSKERYFDQYNIKYRGLNPSASISSSMKAAFGTTPENAYNKGIGYFWASAIKKDDYVLITFTRATAVREVVVETGSLLAPEDQLKTGVLQASYQTTDNDTPGHCTQFEIIGNFKTGRVKVSLNGERKLLCLKILVTQEQKEWIFLREVDVMQS